MQRRLGLPSSHGFGANLTPLVDVVLVVLIFLMLSGSFGGSTHVLLSRLSLKRGVTPQSTAAAVPPAPTLNVYLRESEAGLLVSADGLSSNSDVSSLESALQRRASGLAGAGLAAKDVTVVLHTESRVRYREVIRVYEAVQRSNFSSIAFAAGLK